MSASYPSMRGMFSGKFLIPLVLSVVAGCSGKGTVSGKVLYDGEPLAGGTVIFVTEGQGSFSSTIERDGSYRITRVPTGSVKIAVQGPPRPPDMSAAKAMIPPSSQLKGVSLAKEFEDVGGNPLAGAAKYVKIPEHYGDAEKSGLTFTVTSGSQTFDIPLK